MARECTIEVRVRYAEVDRMGFAHHSRYLVWFEMGRTELFRGAGATYRQCEDDGVLLTVARASLRYRSPARYDDLLLLTTRLVKMGRVKIEHAYELRRKANGTLIATGQTTVGSIDADGKVVPLPPSIRRTAEAPPD